MIFIVFFSLIQLNFAFDILNYNGVQAEYFSINNPEVFIKSNYNYSFFNVSYIISGTSHNSIYNFSLNSENISVGSFSLLDLIKTDNSSFVGAREFRIQVGNDSGVVYLDFEKPFFNLLNDSILVLEHKLYFNFSYGDNSGFINNVSLYKKEGSNEILLANLKNKTEFYLNLSKKESLDLLFKVEDIAGNYYDFEKIIFIDDIFEPKIEKLFLILKDGKYTLDLKIKDDGDLSRYEIYQDLQTFSGLLNGNKVNKSITLPFYDGEIKIQIFDSRNNSIISNIDLTSPIENKNFDLISNKKDFVFTSNADFCYLESIDGREVLKNFTISSNRFDFLLDISKMGKKEIKFYCVLNNFKEYFTKNFFYDFNLPSKSKISAEKISDGGIKLSWLEAEDTESEVSYELYRNNEKIYSGTKLSFLDLEVFYPNEYEYFVKVLDEAENFQDSEIIKVIPIKQEIKFNSNLKETQEVEVNFYDLKINTEIGNNILIKVFNGDVLIDKFIFNNLNSTTFSKNINLTNGINKISVEVSDKIGNKKEESYFINYVDKSLLASNENEDNNSNEVIVEEKVAEILPFEDNLSLNSSNENLVVDSEDYFSYKISLIILFFIILIIILFVSFYLGGNKIEKINENKKNKSNFKSKIKNNSGKNFGSFFRTSADSELSKSLEQVKKKRLKKQQELDYLKSKEGTKRMLSNYDKDKFKSLSEGKTTYDFSSLISKKRIQERTKLNRKKENNLVKKMGWFKEKFDFVKENMKNSPRGDIKKNGINNKSINSLSFNSNKKEVNKLNLNDYLNKITSKKSWKNTSEYLMSTQVKKQQKIDEKEREKLNKLQEEENKRLEEVRKQQNKLENEQKKLLQKKTFESEKEEAKKSLDDYLNKKKKKRNFYFAEMFVNKDIRKRDKEK